MKRRKTILLIRCPGLLHYVRNDARVRVHFFNDSMIALTVKNIAFISWILGSLRCNVQG
jgi:hypothetical protein